jgi:hypothetical protein
MKVGTFEIVTALFSFLNMVSGFEILQFNIHIRPFLLNQHPIFITHRKVLAPDKNLQTFHAEEISSVLVYDFQQLQVDSANLEYLSRQKENFNITGRLYSTFIWTKFPSFLHLFPVDTNNEVYNCQAQFLIYSRLGLTTRPKTISVIITVKNSRTHKKSGGNLLRRFGNKKIVELSVDYYDFALYFKPKDIQPLKFKLFEISSVSVLKFCLGCSAAPKVSWVHFESCKNSTLKTQIINLNCIDKILQIVSEPGLNLSRFGIEPKAHDFEGRQTYGSCESQKIFENDIKMPFSNNFTNVFVQNILLQELVRGLATISNCVWKAKRDLIVVSLLFSPIGNTQRYVYFDFQASSSLRNQRAFNFLTCDGVRKKIDFMGYLDPFDAQTWLGTIVSLLICSCLMSILVSRSQNTSFMDSYSRSFFMNFSFLTGVANAPLKLAVNYQMNTIRILLLSWGITTIVLCTVYSSLVTTKLPQNYLFPHGPNTNNWRNLQKYSG